MIKSTLALYFDTVRETGSALMRGPFVWLFLLALPVVITVASVILSPLGIIGGFIIGFGAVYLYGAHLQASGRVSPAATRSGWASFGRAWDTMSGT